MKAVIVLATAVALVYGAPHLNLGPIITEADCLHNITLETVEFDSVYVKELKINQIDNYEAEFFCQAEKVLHEVNLTNKVCHVDKLLRNLKVYSKGVNCSVPENGDEIILRTFLDNLTKYAKKAYSKLAQTTRVKHSS